MNNFLKIAERLTASLLRNESTGIGKIHCASSPTEGECLCPQSIRRTITPNDIYILHDPIEEYYQFVRERNDIKLYLDVDKNSLTLGMDDENSEYKGLALARINTGEEQEAVSDNEYLAKCFFTLIGYNEANFTNVPDQVEDFKRDFMTTVRGLHNSDNFDDLEQAINTYLTVGY